MDAAREAKLLALVTPAAEARALDGCDLIIEAVFENRELKAAVTREAEPMLAPDGVFASNTSTLPITGLALASKAPERFVGLHFFSPVHKMRLVEIIRGAKTSDETIARAFDYVAALGKTPIVVNDSRGFFTSRVFGTFVMEGAAMLAEGIPAPLIEHAALAAGMPVGPLAVLDETSLALSVHVMEQTRADLAAEGKTFEPSAGQRLVERMVKELKRPGRAGGAGFYDYPAGQAKRLWPGLKSTVRRRGRRQRRPRDPEAPLSLSPVDRDGALLRRRRADERARGQHRLHLRHRLSGLDRRGDAVHRRGRPRPLSRPGRRAGGALRRTFQDRARGARRDPRLSGGSAARRPASLQAQDPLHELSRLGLVDLRVGRHRHRAPDAGAALHHLLHQPLRRIGLAGVLGGDVLVGGADELGVDAVARHAVLALRQLLVGPGRRRRPRKGHDAWRRAAVSSGSFEAAPALLGYHQHSGAG